MTKRKRFDAVARASAIAVFEDELKARSDGYVEHLARGGKADCGEEFYLDALYMAIAALRERDVTDINVGSKWISVEERMPEAEKEVRVLCKASWNSKYRYQCQAFYEPKGMLRENSNYGWDYECCSEYSEEDDDYFVNPGWYERIHNWDDYSAVGIADEVTHWMPLPEPPEEEV